MQAIAYGAEAGISVPSEGDIGSIGKAGKKADESEREDPGAYMAFALHYGFYSTLCAANSGKSWPSLPV